MGELKNRRHENFAQGVALRGMNLENAHKFAGYKAATRRGVDAGRHIYNIPEVRTRIEELQADIKRQTLENTVEDSSTVLENLWKIVMDAWNGTPVLTRDGVATGEIKRDYAAMNRALELIGKYFGMFKEQFEIGKPADFLLAKYDDVEIGILAKAQREIDEHRAELAAKRKLSNGGAEEGQASDLPALPETASVSRLGSN